MFAGTKRVQTPCQKATYMVARDPYSIRGRSTVRVSTRARAPHPKTEVANACVRALGRLARSGLARCLRDRGRCFGDWGRYAREVAATLPAKLWSIVLGVAVMNPDARRANLDHAGRARRRWSARGGAAEPGGGAAEPKARTARSGVTASGSGALPPDRLPQCMVPSAGWARQASAIWTHRVKSSAERGIKPPSVANR